MEQNSIFKLYKMEQNSYKMESHSISSGIAYTDYQLFTCGCLLRFLNRAFFGVFFGVFKDSLKQWGKRVKKRGF